jgi:hypothetical protein
MRTVRSPSLVGRGSRITHHAREELRVEFRPRHARPPDPPRRDPTHNRTMQCVESHYPSTYAIPTRMVAHRCGSATVRPGESTALSRAIAPQKLLGLWEPRPTTAD